MSDGTALLSDEDRAGVVKTIMDNNPNMAESLCARRGGYVHHTPGYNPRNYDASILERTKTRIGELGFDVDAELWGPPGSDPVVVAAKCQHTEECAIMPMPPDPGPTE
ncbi:hypothetical protein [Streptomyces sp. 11-1-2]|uniref:hypothetical protein n=1 Tax=unclassified Streptomyces TaxID=2593676 RepID=UPI000B8D8C88|nr:hypothetical protein [Streptomyces sp. 11-1-2]ASQ98489.1 hypothetical protein CGL27_40660 [Streptomyces sp. 11-1-2]